MLKIQFLNNNSNLLKKHKYIFLVLVSILTSSLYSETNLIVLGSGTPNPDPERYGSAYAVVAVSYTHLTLPTKA